MFGIESLNPEIFGGTAFPHAANWMINLGTLVYFTSVLWMCGQELSVWGYVWRSLVIATGISWADTQIAALIGRETTLFEVVPLFATAPWIGVWVSRRYESRAS